MPDPLFSERAATASATREPAKVVPERTGGEPIGFHEAMRALASVVGNRTFAAQLSPGPTRARIEQALAARDPTLLLPVDDLSPLTPAERLSLIRMCLDQSGGQWQYAFVLGTLWNSLGPDALGPFGRDNWDVWLRSLDAYPGLAESSSVQALKKRFRDDVRKEIAFRLDGSERIVKAETARLEALAESQRDSDAYDLVVGADAYSRLLEAQQALLRVRVRGYRMFQVPNELRTGADWRAVEATFDPFRPPEDRGYPSEPGYDPFEGLPTWEQVSERYAQVTAAMRELGESQPVLYAAARRDRLHEIVAAAGADQTPKEIFEIALEPLYAIAGDIARTRAGLEAGDADPLDFGPIVDAVRFGRIVSDSRTPWGDVFYRWVSAITVGDHSTDATPAAELALAALAILASLIPGAGLVAEGLQIALVVTAVKEERAAWDLADALQAAEGAALRPGEDLVAPGAAAAAHAKAVAASVFVFIAALPYAARFAELSLAEDLGGAAVAADPAQNEFDDFTKWLQEEGSTGATAGEPVTMQPHGGAPQARQMLGMTGDEAQSMHGLPRSVGKHMPGYDPDAALTTLGEKAMHTELDQPWKDAFQTMRRQGRTSASAQEIYDAVANSIDSSTQLPTGVKETLKLRLHDEMFIEYGLQTGQQMTLPYPNITPRP